MVLLYLLFESAYGYALFERKQSDDVAELHDQVQKSLTSYATFSRMVQLKAFNPFESAEVALESANNVAEGVLPDNLRNFLEMNLGQGKKKFELGVTDNKLATSISESLQYSCRSDSTIQELMRGLRSFFVKFVDKLSDLDLIKAQLGLSHSYSRCKVKFNVNRVDNMIIQSICLLDQLDKDVNVFAMRVREWYSWHFPELIRIVSDNYTFARLVLQIGSKDLLSEESLPELTEITNDETTSQKILDASRASMGTELSEIDLINVTHFAKKVVNITAYRKELHDYLSRKMSVVAPNLAALIGEVVGARLISQAGSLINLAKAPASTVQVLGAEKALFRALKTRGNTPKYGLIFNSSFITRASTKDKGRISRYLANKCTIASRIDAFSDQPSSIFGEKLKGQVEERLQFYEDGTVPQKNVDVMEGASTEYAAAVDAANQKKRKKDKKKKKKHQATTEAELEIPQVTEEVVVEETTTKKKKKKKAKTQPTEVAIEEAVVEEIPVVQTETKKKKKKKHTHNQ